MKRLMSLLGLSLVGGALSSCSIGPRLLVSPLDHSGGRAGTIYQAGTQSVTVSVRDERGPGQILGGALLGPIYLGYVSEKENEIVDLFASSAEEVVRALGLTVGQGSTAQISIEGFRVTMYRFSGFSPMNCIGYGNIQALVRGPDGQELARKKLNVTYFEGTTPAWSMKEVAKGAVSRIYRQAAWESSAAALSAAYPGAPDPAQVRRLLGTLDTSKDDEVRRTTIFWLGLTGQGDPAVKEKLLAIFRTSKDQSVRQASVEAIGMLGIQEARGEIEAILSGKKIGDWDNSDTEQVWYLLRALFRMGQSNLASLIPKTDLKQRSMLRDLVSFQETGEIPPMSESERQELEKARKNPRG
jgi:hypothetical protein